MEYDGPRRETALIEQLVDLSVRVQARLAEPCEALGVNAARFAVLRAVANVVDGGCSQSELAIQLGVSESNICALVERLRTSGLLFRFRSKTDRRRSVLMLTERGRELAQAINRAQHAQAVAVMSVFDHDQLLQLHQLLQCLHEHLDSGGVRSIETVPPFSQTPIDQASPEVTRRAS